VNNIYLDRDTSSNQWHLNSTVESASRWPEYSCISCFRPSPTLSERRETSLVYIEVQAAWNREILSVCVWVCVSVCVCVCVCGHSQLGGACLYEVCWGPVQWDDLELQANNVSVWLQLNLIMTQKSQLPRQTHDFTHTHTHTHTHTFTHTCYEGVSQLPLLDVSVSGDEMRSVSPRGSLTFISGFSYAHTHTWTHSHTCARTHTQKYTCTHTRTHTRTHNHTCTHTHTHTLAGTHTNVCKDGAAVSSRRRGSSAEIVRSFSFCVYF